MPSGYQPTRQALKSLFKILERMCLGDSAPNKPERNVLRYVIHLMKSDVRLHDARRAVARVLPRVAHQLCQFHYLREAAKEVYEADRHAKKELKKRVRGVRPIEREVEGRNDPESEAVRGYCLAVRSAITDDGRPPLSASGIKLHERIEAIQSSIERVETKRGFPGS